MIVEIDDLVGKFEARTMSRRELVAALAGVVAASAAPASAQTAAPTLVAQGRTINHVSMAEKLKQQGIQATVDRNPANRTSGGDQLYFTDADKTRVQLGPNGYQG